MVKRNHLRLVVSNKQTNKNLFRKFWQWLNQPRWFQLPALPFVTTQLEKEQEIQEFLTLKFAEYQATTGSVELFPLCEAMNEVQRLKKQGKINAYYRVMKKKMAR